MKRLIRAGMAALRAPGSAPMHCAFEDGGEVGALARCCVAPPLASARDEARGIDAAAPM